jgi:hypothetical protein
MSRRRRAVAPKPARLLAQEKRILFRDRFAEIEIDRNGQYENSLILTEQIRWH